MSGKAVEQTIAAFNEYLCLDTSAARVVEQDRTSFQAEGLFSDVGLLMPDDEVQPVIERTFILRTGSYPYKSFIAMRIRRGERRFRALFPIAVTHKPILDGQEVTALIGDFFTREEALAALGRNAFLLPQWEGDDE